MSNIKYLLLDQSSSIEEYFIKREFYGYLNNTGAEEPNTEGLDDIMLWESTFEAAPKNDHYEGNFNKFDNIHRTIPPISPDCKSIFNLLDEDIHKNY